VNQRKLKRNSTARIAQKYFPPEIASYAQHLDLLAREDFVALFASTAVVQRRQLATAAGMKDVQKSVSGLTICWPAAE
jgi:hypothetical protein